MPDDIVLVTADSVRRDFVEEMEFVASHDVHTGIAAGHYTRPSLASLQSSRLLAAVESKVIGPSLAAVLSEAGYTTIGLVPTAQADPTFGFDAGFDYYDNYMQGGGNPARNRRSSLRELLGSFDVVRQLYRRVYPMEANMADLPADGDVIDEAIDRFERADRPRFLWVHLMGSHRPYGTGEEAVPGPIDRKAEAAGGRHWFGSSTVTDAEHDIIVEKYREALARTDRRIRRLVEGIDADPIVAFAADHGDELGEEGYYYHQGYRRRVADPIVRVPVVLDGVDVVGDRCSLLDVAPTLVSAVGGEVPAAWHGNDLAETRTDQAVTIAPWHDTATIAWQDFQRKLVAADADVSMETDARTTRVERSEVPTEVERRLQDLGYTDAG